MAEFIVCKICRKRRARRFCPAVQGDICTLCCGTEREVSLSCPLECEYLQDAHQHERPVPVPESEIADQDIEITEEFVSAHSTLLMFCMFALVDAAAKTPGAIDSDVMAALEALIQTYRTLGSGLIYQSRPENSVAAAVQRSFTETFAEYEKERSERESFPAARTSDTLAILVFIHRVGQQSQNGRPRGRMFIDLMKHWVPERAGGEGARSIIL
jgi:hypothetical protein